MYKMATVQPITDQPEQVPIQIAPAIRAAPTGGVSVWGSGLCGCCNDISSCCVGWFCCPILACCVSSEMEECCCTGCVSLPALRTKYRTQQGIPGSVCNDCIVSSVCFPCVLCQLKRELKN